MDYDKVRAEKFGSDVHQATPPGGHKAEPEDAISGFSSRWLERADSVIYAIVGASFLVGALCALVYSFWTFGTGLNNAIGGSSTAGGVADTIIQFVSDLLLVLIIMEVLGTVLHYLKSHATSLRPFLFIGIVSATRSILSIGARLSISGTTDITKAQNVIEFRNSMIELGVSAAVVLALGITIKLLGKLIEEEAP
jgi:uncharacterized membrane protein (DUF373 family)